MRNILTPRTKTCPWEPRPGESHTAYVFANDNGFSEIDSMYASWYRPSEVLVIAHSPKKKLGAFEKTVFAIE